MPKKNNMKVWKHLEGGLLVMISPLKLMMMPKSLNKNAF